MDIEAFSDENFDAAQWINLAYKNSTTAADSADNSPQSSKEVFVSGLVSKLQLYVQQLNSALEDTSQQVLAGMPRIMKDANNLQNEAFSLRAKMSEVQNDIAQVQKDTGACMANLERLDVLKTKLQVAKQGLQESDGWGRLTSELEELLERNDIVNACDKLQSLQHSLAAQVGLAGQSEREVQVEGFKNRIEAIASPGVVQSFTSGDVEKSKKHVDIFDKMERLPQLTQYYRTVQKGMLQQQWSEIVETAVNSGSVNFLREYYDYLNENWQKQHKWCSIVFGTSASGNSNFETISVITELLPSLQPTREIAINNLLKRSNDKLFILTEISSANIYFGDLMQKQIESLSNKPSPNLLKSLTAAIFDYFIAFFSQFASIEQQNLSNNLTELQLMQATAAESVRSLGNSNSKVMKWCEDSLEQCKNITQYCGLPALIIVLNQTFKSYLDKYQKVQQQLNASRRHEQIWSLLQTCISCLQSIGDFKLQLDDFERKINEIVHSKCDQLQSSEHDLYYGYKLLSKREKNDFRKLIEVLRNSDENSNESMFGATKDLIKSICKNIHDTTFTLVFLPVDKHLTTIKPPADSQNSTGNDLPDYSFAPQEFITQVGQYLLTLPQHLEPLLLSPTAQLKISLELSNDKYTGNIASADVLLSLIAEECCDLYEEQINQIVVLNVTESKQLATDIEYLGSVLEELGLSLGSHLQQMATLLRAPPENYLALSGGCSPKLVTAIRQMRNIISME